MSYFDNLRTFVRIYELGSMSAAARDQRISPAVTSARISQLESHLGVRLFQRTTRSLTPTEQGRIFYDGACAVLEAVEAAEAGVGDATENPRGTLHIAAPLGVGRRLIAPHVPEFTREFPLGDVRLRMRDRKIDLTAEGLDIAFLPRASRGFQPAHPQNRRLRARPLRRALLHCRDMVIPRSGAEIDRGKHNCLNLRFPGAREFQWELSTSDGPRKFDVQGRFECDDSDVLTDWALQGAGIALRPVFEIAATFGALALWSRSSRTPLPCLCKWRVYIRTAGTRTRRRVCLWNL